MQRHCRGIGPRRRGELQPRRAIHSAWRQYANLVDHFGPSTMALAKLLESSDESLASISVKGDLIPDTSNTIRTRSRAKLNPHLYTSIPLPAKILKILIAEYDSAGDGPPSRLLPGVKIQDDDDLEEEDDDDEWDDDEPETGKKHITEDRFLSSLLNADMDDLNALAAQGDADFGLDDDAEGGLETDEVWQMDLKVSLACCERKAYQKR